MDEQQAAPAGQDQGQAPESQVLKDMIVQTDQALHKITVVLSKISPDAAQDLAELNSQFREIIQEALSGQGGQGQGGQQAAPQMADAQSQGKAVQQAY